MFTTVSIFNSTETISVFIFNASLFDPIGELGIIFEKRDSKKIGIRPFYNITCYKYLQNMETNVNINDAVSRR